MKIYELEPGTLKKFGQIGLKREMIFRVKDTGFAIFVDTLNPRLAFKYMYIAGISTLDQNRMVNYWGKGRHHYKYKEEAFEVFWRFLKETKQEGEP
jgi:hypothetical protein